LRTRLAQVLRIAAEVQQGLVMAGIDPPAAQVQRRAALQGESVCAAVTRVARGKYSRSRWLR